MNLTPWVTPRSDTQLLIRVARKDSAALDELYERYTPAVLSIALSATPDLAAAEAVVKDIFWMVWERAEDLYDSRRAGVFREWLLLMASQLGERFQPNEKLRTPAELVHSSATG